MATIIAQVDFDADKSADIMQEVITEKPFDFNRFVREVVKMNNEQRQKVSFYMQIFLSHVAYSQ